MAILVQKSIAIDVRWRGPRRRCAAGSAALFLLPLRVLRRAEYAPGNTRIWAQKRCSPTPESISFLPVFKKMKKTGACPALRSLVRIPLSRVCLSVWGGGGSAPRVWRPGYAHGRRLSGRHRAPRQHEAPHERGRVVTLRLAEQGNHVIPAQPRTRTSPVQSTSQADRMCGVAFHGRLNATNSLVFVPGFTVGKLGNRNLGG